MGRSAQPMKHENAQKISSKISSNFSPNSSPRISPGHKNLSPQFRSGECQASPKTLFIAPVPVMGLMVGLRADL